MGKMTWVAPNDAVKVFFQLIQTLPTFWATWIWILRIFIYDVFWIPNLWISRFPDCQNLAWAGLGPWAGWALGWAGLGLGLGPGGPSGPLWRVLS